MAEGIGGPAREGVAQDSEREGGCSTCEWGVEEGDILEGGGS